jgi:hypothetical protein
VSAVRYELGFYIPEDAILQTQYRSLTSGSVLGRYAPSQAVLNTDQYIALGQT